MSKPASLLPPSATAPMRAVEVATARLGEVPTPIRAIWDPATCPVAILPWLAWAFSVDEWDEEWSEQVKRRAIADAIALHRRKGTVWSIKRAIANAGFGDSTLLEGGGANSFNGEHQFNGLIPYGDPSFWATYRFILKRPITNDQASLVRRILNTYAPARCHLLDLAFTGANNRYNGAISFDGAYNHGVAT